MEKNQNNMKKNKAEIMFDKAVKKYTCLIEKMNEINDKVQILRRETDNLSITFQQLLQVYYWK